MKSTIQKLAQPDSERVVLTVLAPVPDLGLRSGDALVIRDSAKWSLVRHITPDVEALREGIEWAALLATSPVDEEIVQRLLERPSLPRRRGKVGKLALVK